MRNVTELLEALDAMIAAYESIDLKFEELCRENPDMAHRYKIFAQMDSDERRIELEAYRDPLKNIMIPEVTPETLGELIRAMQPGQRLEVYF